MKSLKSLNLRYFEEDEFPILLEKDLDNPNGSILFKERKIKEEYDISAESYRLYPF